MNKLNVYAVQKSNYNLSLIDMY